ncbi:hypothetical protein CH063_08762 [Colletotrichum higginsianum]|uniref:Ankyrin repeat protein n=1 Tax=Colletotrichum higginsianum (strain IMI 349063) TaxID=759273 RepID=H1VB31_COLHI|nr:hypothetical protein CH063_08762 [Colletotrichum higginsianum]
MTERQGAVKAYKHPTLDFFKRLEEDANRVRDSITTLLDLRQREANIEEALSASEQSKILFIFTGATVVFAPLSWATGIFQIDVVGLAQPATAGTLLLACFLSLVATLLLIALSLQIYEFITQGKATQLYRRVLGFFALSLLRRSSVSQPVASTAADERKGGGVRKRFAALGVRGRRKGGDEEKGVSGKRQ